MDKSEKIIEKAKNKFNNQFDYRKSFLKTEHQIMLERGIYRIYDSGTITFSKIIN